jgi:NhaA family Na+:H+ antiporter
VRLLPSQIIERTRNRFNQFFKATAKSSIILLATTVIALIWANSSLGQTYFNLWKTHLTVAIGQYMLDKSLSHWVNDGLMAIFFLVIGLEIKREFMIGELSQKKDAILPLAAAIGGMIVPALLYVALNPEGSSLKGWGIPMATDIAFALGILSLLGDRIPLSLKVFLTATAIVDDLGAILVIAIFYTDKLAITPLIISGVIMLILIISNQRGIKRPIVYTTLGVALWLAILKSGLHATLAGVLLAATIPARSKIDPQKFITDSLTLLESFQNSAPSSDEIFLNQVCVNAISNLEENIAQVEPLIQKWERDLHNIAAYLIIPVFSLVNSGVDVFEVGINALTDTISLGIIIGLVVGKPLGIVLFTWLVTQFKIAYLPQRTTWRHIIGAGFLAGIGFTMSIFVAGLAFESAINVATAKIAIITASLLSGIIGIIILRTQKQVKEEHILNETVA